MTHFRQAVIEKIMGHKYAIDAKSLGDDSLLAWSNLGYWDSEQHDYPLACQALADRLARSVQLQPTDRVLDLGCGQGASLLYWLRHYQLQQLSAVELQPRCVQRIQKNLPQVESYCASFLNLKQLPFLNSFDVVMCLDAAYHSDLNLFLNAVAPVLNSKGRLAFHYLMWSDTWQHCSLLKQRQYHYLLKGADVAWRQIMSQDEMAQTLSQQGFEQIEIQDFSEPVLNGFADYIQHQCPESRFGLAQLKIAMTAKLCRKLYRDGLLRYVQISAVKR